MYQTGEFEILLCLAPLALAILLGAAFLILKRRYRVPAKWDKIVGLTMIMVLFSPFCLWMGDVTFSSLTNHFTPKPLYPTHEELRRRGFYIFELPKETIEQRQWKQEIIIGSWNIHCGVLLGDTYNPLIIKYTDNSENEVFRIQLAWRIIWNLYEAESRTQVDLDTEWADPKTLTYYTRPMQNDNLTRNLYHFRDLQGYGVDIVSSISVTETLGMIKQLEYIGPPIETLKDPWYCGN